MMDDGARFRPLPVQPDVSEVIAMTGQAVGTGVANLASRLRQAQHIAVTLEQDAAEARRLLAALVAAYPQTSWAETNAAVEAAKDFLASE